MIKLQILIPCEHCDGSAYVPVGEAASSTGEPYIRHIPLMGKQQTLDYLDVHNRLAIEDKEG
jgi:hypothetical protein